MLEEFVGLIRCPNCNKSLKIEIFERFDEHRIKDGILICECDSWFPIINGVPRLLVGSLRNLIKNHHSIFLKKYANKLYRLDNNSVDFIQEKTAKTHDVGIKKPSNDFKNNSQSFECWIDPVKTEYLKNKIILDAGCRIGINTYHSASFDAKLVIGVDIGETVEIAYELNRDCKNVLILQADLNKVPTNQIFDFIFSIGVLHHIPNQKQGLINLSKKVKPRGKIFLWVYGFENYFNLKEILFLRNFTTKTNIKIIRIVSIIFTTMFFAQIKFYKKFKKNKNRNKWLDYLSDFKFKDIEAYVFNQLAPPIAKYYTKEEFEEFCKIDRYEKIHVVSRWDNSWKGIIDLK